MNAAQLQSRMRKVSSKVPYLSFYRSNENSNAISNLTEKEIFDFDPEAKQYQKCQQLEPK